MLVECLSIFSNCLDVFQNSLEFEFSVFNCCSSLSKYFVLESLISRMHMLRSCLYFASSERLMFVYIYGVHVYACELVFLYYSLSMDDYSS